MVVVVGVCVCVCVCVFVCLFVCLFDSISGEITVMNDSNHKLTN